MTTICECGIIYAATKHTRYLYEAFLSGESVKRQSPNFSITLFTDQPEHYLCSTGVFDRVEAISSAAGFASTWAEGQLNRARALLQTPYRHTLHLDTDTLVVTSELHSIFDKLTRLDVAMVEESVENSYSRYFLGRRMFNSGFMLYRKTQKTWDWLQKWAEISERNFKGAANDLLPDLPSLKHVEDATVRRKLLRNDQVSMTEIFSPDVNTFELDFESLDRSWNYRMSKLDRYSVPLGARVLHARHSSAINHLTALRSAAGRLRLHRPGL